MGLEFLFVISLGPIQAKQEAILQRDKFELNLVYPRHQLPETRFHLIAQQSPCVYQPNIICDSHFENR